MVAHPRVAFHHSAVDTEKMGHLTGFMSAIVIESLLLTKSCVESYWDISILIVQERRPNLCE